MTLEELQKQIAVHKWDAYVVTRGNMFIGQDVLPEENQVKALSGFSGSAGTLFVMPDKAWLLTDGRYELQAAAETDSEKISVVVTSDSLGSWLQKKFASPLKIAYDPWCHSIGETEFWNRTLKKHQFIEDNERLLGCRLSSAQPEIFELDAEYAGVTAEEKISYFCEFLRNNDLTAYFIGESDVVSWLLNLRSNALPDTPVLRAFALINKDGEVSLFTSDVNKIEAELAAYKGKSIGLSANATPKKIQTLMKNHKIWISHLQNPAQKWKSVKNPVELKGFEHAHQRDGIALCRFLQWLENRPNGQSELSIVSKLKEFRARDPLFRGNSFETIAGVGANGAVVHYQPTARSNRPLTDGTVLLLDSGAQYCDGTTDVTRTIALGQAPQEMIDSYTQVLKAHIAAASAYFPTTTPGSAIDTLARAQLWRFGKDYNHGTGHGVGHYLNVHEAPVSLSRRGTAQLEANQVTSIEPGYYKTGEYGIRIENLYYVTTGDENLPQMLKFAPLTLVPLDKRLINKYLLTAQEIRWIDDYHRLVCSTLAPQLEQEVRIWLEQACAPL